MSKEGSENEDDKHNLFPLREVPTAPGITGFLNVPINTGDVRTFRKEMGRLLDDPFGVADRLDEFLGSSIYTFEDLTSILKSLFNTEERDMIRQAGIRDWERRNPQGTPGEQKWPSQSPGWNSQTEEGRRNMIDLRNIIIQGIREAVLRGQNISRVFGECQGKEESPSEWLDQIWKSLQVYSRTDSTSPIGEVLLKTQFVAKSWEDIRKNLEKIDNWQEKSLQELLREAQKVYMRRDEENQKIQAKVLVAAVKEVQKQERYRDQVYSFYINFVYHFFWTVDLSRFPGIPSFMAQAVGVLKLFHRFFSCRFDVIWTLTPARREGTESFQIKVTICRIRGEVSGTLDIKRQWIEGYSEKVKFLYERLNTDRVKWTEQDKLEFKRLKEALMTSPVLSLPDVKRQFQLFVDVSNHTAHGVLTQDWAGAKKPVGYVSKLLDLVSRGWPTCLQAIVAVALLVEEAKKVQVDFTDLPKVGRYKFLLVIVDKLTHWVEAYPRARATVQTVSKVLLEKIIPRFGIADHIDSDQGTHFTSKIIKQTTEALVVQGMQIAALPTDPELAGGKIGQLSKASKLMKLEEKNRAAEALEKFENKVKEENISFQKYCEITQEDWDEYDEFLDDCLDKNHFLANARRNSFLTTMQISSTPWHDMQTEINIRLTCVIDIRKEPSRNGTTGLDKIREGHRKEIRTIQPTLDTWTA
ncbi:hypothetical protein HGM15179_018170 [Zosterops borbonicus]|uniref:Integrase catalytic domain-containing protein n=1 Tax=Zosterops borbonicus TaxID=364589 RepID=A0A8K1FZI6_9PASS|nr:hypothetical protein HGM15179_018170 [Zosterops borbonicus]